MVESHSGLTPDDVDFGERVETAIETLVAIGDLLELGDVALEGDVVKGTWLVAAPPAFVARESGSVFLLGLSADEQTPLPMEMRSRVAFLRTLRTIDPVPDEDLPAVLRDFGMRELSSAAWLRAPRQVEALDLVAGYDEKLLAQHASGDIPNMLVLDGCRNTRSYRRRWTPPGSLSGKFVVRRPQTFGSDLWGYAELFNGSPLRLLDLPAYRERWRGCDAAWRLQMASDAVAGRPQEYRLERTDDGARIGFFSPIPVWARRRLAAIGQECEPVGCLLSFLVPAREAAAEERFLKDMLYLTRAAE